MSASEGTQLARVSLSYAGDTSTLNQARSDLADLLGTHHLAAMVADAELVLSELTSNAVRASPGEPFQVVVTIAARHLSIAVTNRSDAVLPDRLDWVPDDVLAPHGRGLFIADALSSSVTFDSQSGKLTVTAILDIVRD